MVTIKIHDYYDAENWCYNGVGMGRNSAEIVNAQIEAAVKAKEDITVDINSGGGYVYDGFSIYNALMKARKHVNVTTINSGLACSIASVIFVAGEFRIVFSASLFMMHPPTIDLFWYGSMDAAGLKREAAALEVIESVLSSIYVEATGLPENVVKDMIKATTWLTPTECKMQGFATEVNGSSSKPNAIEEVMNNIKRNAPANIQAYTNKFFNTITNTMAKQESEAKKATNETKGLLTKLKGALNKMFPGATDVVIVLKDGTSVYADGELAVGVDVYSDEDMLIPIADGTHTLEDDSTFVTVDGAVESMAEAEANEDDAQDATALQAENEILTTENLTLKEENADLLNSLRAANKLINKINASASNYKPAKRKNEFSTGKDVDAPAAKFIKPSTPKKA